MDDLYTENFFKKSSQLATPTPTAASNVLEISEESTSQIHFHLRVLKEEISKQLKEMPPFPLMLEKLESAIFSQNDLDALAVIDDLEELLDLQYLPNA